MNEEIECPDCNGTGYDYLHLWPDGSPASCARCEGYGDIDAPSTTDALTKYRHAMLCDMTVHYMTNIGCPDKQIIGQLAAEKEELLARVVELSALAPRRLLVDGALTIPTS